MSQETRVLPPVLSPLQAGLGALPFFLFGLSSVISKVNFFQTTPVGLPLWQILFVHPYLVFNWLILIGLGIGLLAGFPRWAYSFLGWAILFGWWWGGMGFYGYYLGWQIWLPLAGVIALALLIKRSWQPLRSLFNRLWQDWTLLSLAIYILYSFVYMFYDENHHPYLLVFVGLTTLVISLGAWGYFRLASPLPRVLALVGGLFSATVLNTISEATWDYAAYYGLPPSSQAFNPIGLVFFIFLAVIMLSFGFISAWRVKRGANLAV